MVYYDKEELVTVHTKQNYDNFEDLVRKRASCAKGEEHNTMFKIADFF